MAPATTRASRFLPRAFVVACALVHLACASGRFWPHSEVRRSDPYATRRQRVAEYTALSTERSPTPIIDVAYVWHGVTNMHSDETPGSFVATLRVAPEDLLSWGAGCVAEEDHELPLNGRVVDGWPTISSGSDTYRCGEDGGQWRRFFAPDGILIEEMVF